MLYIGDSEYDYYAAKNAGVKFALVDFSVRKDTILEKPDYVISSYDKFFEEIK